MKFVDVQVNECYVFSNHTARHARLEGNRIYPLADKCYLRTSGPLGSGPNYRPFTRGEYKPHGGSTGLLAVVIPGYANVSEEADRVLRELTIEQVVECGGRLPEYVVDALVASRVSFTVETVQIQWVNQTWEKAQEIKKDNEARWALERQEKAAKDKAQYEAMSKSADMLEKLLGTRPAIFRPSSYDDYTMRLNEGQAKALADLARVILPGVSISKD